MVEMAGDGGVGDGGGGGWGGGGVWWGGCCVLLSQPNPSCQSVVFLTRASARLIGVCLGACRRRSCGLFTKTYVSDYDRWGPRTQSGGGGQGDAGLQGLCAEEPLLMSF